PHLARGDLEAAAHAAAEAIARLLDLFGHGNVAVELIAGGGGADDELHDALAQGARLVRESHGLDETTLPLVGTTTAHYAAPADPYLSSRPAHLRSGEEMVHLLARYPQAISAAVRMGQDCALDLRLLAPDLPPSPVPAGHDEASWLIELVEIEGRQRYGPRPAP